MTKTRKAITEVFTPRNQEINESMYVDRPLLEKNLLRSLRKQTNTLIFGESGNGKSWLYKKVLSASKIPYVVANCANASRHNAIANEICNAIEDDRKELDDLSNFDSKSGDPLLSAFQKLADKAGDKKIIVLDNLESIFGNETLMNELANIIILLDDDRYGRFNINFLVVGVPNGVLDYFSKTKHLDSVANRLEEMDKVGSLNERQVSQIVTKGFEQLAIEFPDDALEDVLAHIYKVTLGIAQKVHEYCEQLAYEIEDNGWVFETVLLRRADLNWLKKGLRKSYTVIQHHLNSRDTTVARRNQAIYAIGQLSTNQFDSSQIDSIIRDQFPTTVNSTNMGIGSILTELSKGESPLLDRNAKTNEYTVRDPRYVMCIRLMLYIDEHTNKIEKRKFER